MTRKIDIVSVDLKSLNKAKLNLLKVKANVVKKLSVSTTTAQGHLGLISSLRSDLDEIDSMIEAATPKEETPAKVPATPKKDKEV
jgi:hypothetical protein